jgi:hypothetical protein
VGNTVHAFADLDEKVSVADEGLELVLLHDAGANIFKGDSHVLVLLHGSVQVEGFDVDRHKFCIGIGEGSVKEALGCGYVGGGSTSPGGTE